MQIAISRQNIGASKTEPTAARSSAQTARSGSNRWRRWRRRWSSWRTPRAKVNDARRFHENLQRARAARAFGSRKIKVFLPHHGSEFGVHRVDRILAAPKHQVLESF